ncbi:DUF6786 family protein [Paenibacillus sp.]|uniref:DUF6786 family protein n=1 Tax=Paenibacillus sp. TaxID=58172 RepID=UPI002810C812|nr:DUF6786 family protein [Paenibacillus sp.]
MTDGVVCIEALLKLAGQPYEVLRGADGGRLLVLVKGGRILDLRASDGYDSALWNDLSAVESGEWNTGGDRTWISPEMDYFMDEYGIYKVPSQLDPGNWEVIDRSQDGLSLRNECHLRHRSTSAMTALKMEKQISLAANPLTMNVSALERGLSALHYIGYEVSTSLSISAVPSFPQPASGYCGQWTILQVPAGGSVLVPTIGTVRPMTMFADREPDYVRLSEGGVSIHCIGSHGFKLSFDALASTGRIGYTRRLNEKEHSLVVRQFTVNPAGVYPDYPPDKPGCLGSCTQVYYDGGKLGGYAELEYQSPALRIDAPGTTTERTQVFHYTGLSASVAMAAELLLGGVAAASWNGP